MHTAVVVCNDSTRVVSVNAAAEALFEASARQIQGRELSAICLDCEPLVDATSTAMNENHAVSAYGLHIQLSPAHGIEIDAHINLIPSDGVLLELLRVDELLGRARQEASIEQTAANRDVLKGLAHEIKNPLGGLRGAAQLLDRELAHREQKEYTRIIIHEADRLRDLVDRMMGGGTPTLHETINLHRILEHVRKLVQAETPGMEFLRDYDPSLPDATGDPGQLTQALLNITRNAVQATLGRGTITLRTRVASEHLLEPCGRHRVLKIDIEDNGPGVPENIKPKVFLPMVTDRPEGSGLGLSIAQDIVRHHRGRIDLESRPGFTRFSVLLPWAENGGNS